MFRILVLSFTLFISYAASSQIYEVQKGMIRFYSEAPQELIRASTQELKGAIDIQKKTFAFKVANASFIGFNSPLQREHFNENYMETEVFSESSFTGKIIEDFDVAKDGDYKLRAKGKLNIHGIERERIIEVELKIKNGKVVAHSDFVLSLVDHNIKIPKVVYDKLAPDIHVSVAATLSLRGTK